MSNFIIVDIQDADKIPAGIPFHFNAQYIERGEFKGQYCESINWKTIAPKIFSKHQEIDLTPDDFKPDFVVTDLVINYQEKGESKTLTVPGDTRAINVYEKIKEQQRAETVLNAIPSQAIKELPPQDPEPETLGNKIKKAVKKAVSKKPAGSKKPVNKSNSKKKK